MDVANKDLCAELEVLSGWGDTVWFHFQDRLWTSHEIRGKTMTEDNRAVPAYTLGYLLRKLPPKLEKINTNVWLTLQPMDKDGSWGIGYEYHLPNGEAQTDEFQWAESVEDAACKLVIELFKQGILTPKENE